MGSDSDWSVMADASAALADQPAVRYHFYGKQPRPGRKVGHVTAGGAELDDVVFRARAAAAFFED